MTTRAPILAAVALTAAAGAQEPFTTGSTVTYTLGFVEIGGNTNGALEPGESALIRVSVAFSNQNTTATYTPPSPGPGSGTIRGFGLAYIDLNGAANNGGNANGVWDVDPAHGYGPDPVWDILGAPGWGIPTLGGSRLRDIQFGQFPLGGAPQTTNPIHLIYTALWTPDSYSPRTVAFSTTAATSANRITSAVILRVSSSGLAMVLCPSEHNSVSIPIIPAPACTLCLLTLVSFRRRSR